MLLTGWCGPTVRIRLIIVLALLVTSSSIRAQDSESEWTCVPYYMCDPVDYTIITDGKGLIEPRSLQLKAASSGINKRKEGQCIDVLDVLCKLPVTNRPVRQIPITSEGHIENPLLSADCNCVLADLCRDEDITDGSKIIDIRLSRSCSSDAEVCCKFPASVIKAKDFQRKLEQILRGHWTQL